MAPIENEDLNEEFEEEMDDSEVITVPLDTTLSHSGEAAEAKAVGDALAQKADKSELQAAITVNGQEADAQGVIIVTAEDTKVSSTDTTTIKEAIDELDGRTGADIPVSNDPGAPTIAEALGDAEGMTAESIPMAPESQTTIGMKISAMERVETQLGNAVTELAGATGETIKLTTDGNETIADAVVQRVKTINGEGPDASGNVEVNHTLTADNLTSSQSQNSIGEWTRRTSGGAASISDGTAWMSGIRGNRSHVGYVPEVLNMTVTTAPREAGEDPITATIDRDTFVAYVEESSTINLVYTTGWNISPTLYGVTVDGTPVSGDQITINYTAEDRGTIIQANPQRMVSTGYNLYNHELGYAIGLKYSEQYGFRIEGTYTAVKYSSTESGSKTTLVPVDGLFDIPANGYIWVEGGNDTDTEVYMTWSDWQLGRTVSFSPYTEGVIDLAIVMEENFPYGLLRAGDVRDEIDFNTGLAISNIQRLEYSEENLESARASGRTYEYDTNYIYLERALPVTTEVEIDGEYNVSDHGLEYFTETSVAVYAIVLYGNNLKNKLERDVLTISAQDLTSTQQEQARDNIGAASEEDLTALESNIPSVFQLKPGTSSTYSKMYAPGYISGSGAYIEVFINCDASKITSITNVTADRIDIKCKSGNIFKTSGFSFNSAIKAPNGVLLEFAWGSTLSDQSTGCFFVLENVKFVCT